jgi:chemotaxis protein histidine kinase CheA
MAAKTSILHIGAQKEVLSKRQKEFNRLTKKIEQLEKVLTAFREGKDRLHHLVSKEMNPLYQQMNAMKAEIVRSMDVIFTDKIFKKGDKKKLSYLITDLSFDLIGEDGYEDLKSIFNKHSEVDYDAINAEVELEAAEMAKNMASHFGMHFEEDEDISTKEKFQERIFEKLFEMDEESKEQERIKDEKKAQRPKTQKQLEKEEKQKNEENRLTKSVRAIYMDLVKAFHPDREKDESEKLRKTEVMQRVTQAYNENNLMALLKLQMELDRIDQSHLESLADEQLIYYNKILKQQADELEYEKFYLIQDLAS